MTREMIEAICSELFGGSLRRMLANLEAQVRGEVHTFALDNPAKSAKVVKEMLAERKAA